MNKHYKIYITTDETVFDSKTFLYIVDYDWNVVYCDWFESRYSRIYSLIVKLAYSVIDDSSLISNRNISVNSIISDNSDVLVLEGTNGFIYEEQILYSTDFYTIC